MSFHYTKKNYSKYHLIAAVTLGVIINVILSLLTTALNLPLYLDTIGTIFVAILGGGLPGIITGMATNIILSFFVSGYLYFSIINVILALLASWFVRYSRRPRFVRITLFVLLSSIICSGLGMVIQRLIPGLPMIGNLEEASAFLSNDNDLFNFVSLVTVSFFHNLVDKGISIFIAILICKLIPDSIKESIANYGWKQKPLSLEEIRQYRKNSGRKTVLNKVTSLLSATIIILSLILIWISISFYFEDCKEEYTNEAHAIVDSVASIIDAEEINEFVKWGRMADGYEETEKLLSILLNNTQGVEKLSVLIAENNGYLYVFQVGKEDVKLFDNGIVMPYENIYSPYIDRLKKGEAINEIIINNETDVWIAVKPLKNSAGETVCYVAADVYMSFLSEYTRGYLIKTFLCFSGFIVLILVLGFTHAGYNLVFPIDSITHASGLFLESHGNQKALDENVRKTRAMAIRTEDEVEELYVALCKMESEMAEYVRDIRHYAETTKKMQNGLIITLAGIVENRDSDTNSHIPNITAYVRIILNSLKRKGYYPEKISDEYIEEVEMSAPLHDIGKIHISDNIVKKRSNELTEEEANILKTHTVYGREIMEKAIESVKGDTYLKEARNMAAYHHERWDGKGYPEGLHGEVIPLSARVMSLADYLDDLTSPKGFNLSYSLEEAVDMIQAESGKRFDPKCVEALMDSLNEVKVVLNNISFRRF